MRSAKEWQHQWRFHLSCPNPEQIQEIQQDAYKSGLLRAAQVCRKGTVTPKQTSPAKFANAIIEAIALAIEAEAQKGQP